MKKLLIAIFVFTSSFVFLESVDAKEYSYDYSSSLEYINEKFFTIKEHVESTYSSLNKDYYFIFVNNQTNSYFVYYANVDLSVSFLDKFYGYDFIPNNPQGGFYLDNYKNYPDYFSSTYSNVSQSFYSTNYYLLYTNLEFKLNNVSDTVKFLNGDIEHVINPNDKFLTVYDLYMLDNNIEVPVNHEKELTILSNFYNLVIEKVKFLCDVIISNYIYLSIIVIFLLFIIFEFLRRRLL